MNEQREQGTLRERLQEKSARETKMVFMASMIVLLFMVFAHSDLPLAPADNLSFHGTPVYAVAFIIVFSLACICVAVLLMMSLAQIRSAAIRRRFGRGRSSTVFLSASSLILNLACVFFAIMWLHGTYLLDFFRDV